MTDKVEIQGKTVDEAVSEALLRMGARRDEVDVTVLEEPKTGFLGLLGSRPARVIVRRRRAANTRRSGDHRQTDTDHQPHDLGGGTGRGSRGGRSNRGRSGARTENAEPAREGRGRGGEARRDGRSGGRGGSRNDAARDGRSDGRSRGRSAAAKPERDEAKAGAPSRDGNGNQEERRSGTRRRRGRRGGRGRSGGGRDQQAAQNAAVEQDRTPETVGNAAVAAENTEARNGGSRPSNNEPDRDGGNRRSGGRGGRRRNERPAPVQAEREQERPAAPDQGNNETADRGSPPARPAAAMVDEPIAAGIKALSYAQPQPATTEAGLDEVLGNLGSGMLVRAGFPCRCEVKPGEYRLVKVVTDDVSAGMLIGRHGQTIDAVEHLVERMISTAAGDRVRMNLDINNYRRRRQDSLVDRVAQAVAEVQASGDDYHLEPMDARERRICHLEAALTDGLRTWTVNGPGGKHVVIGIDDGTTRADEIDPREVDEDEQDIDQDQEQAAAPDSTETVLLDADSLDLPAEEDEQDRPGAGS